MESILETDAAASMNLRAIPGECETKNAAWVRRVCIPAELMQEIEAADLHGIVRDLVYWIIYRSLTTKAKCCAINQTLLDASVNSKRRQKLIGFIKRSQYIRPASQGLYRPGRQSRRYELHSLPILSEQEYQHNNEIVSDADLSDVVGGVCWRTVDFGLLLEAIRVGWDRLGWDRARKNAEWSLLLCDDSALTDAEIIEEKSDPVVAAQHIAAHSRFAGKPTEGIFRKDGRVYTSVTSLPKWIRERVVKFNGESETIDVSTCYAWIFSAEHRAALVRSGGDTQEVDVLLSMIERGDFYRVIAERAGVETSEAKREFNTFCLFGPIGFHPLWHALAEICPGVCDDIRWWRSQPGGATRLAHFLQRGEGALMTDGVIDWLVSGGIPAVQIHDGAVVPAGVAEVAAEWLAEHSKNLFGRSCRVKTELAR